LRPPEIWSEAVTARDLPLVRTQRTIPKAARAGFADRRMSGNYRGGAANEKPRSGVAPGFPNRTIQGWGRWDRPTESNATARSAVPGSQSYAGTAFEHQRIGNRASKRRLSARIVRTRDDCRPPSRNNGGGIPGQNIPRAGDQPARAPSGDYLVANSPFRHLQEPWHDAAPLRLPCRVATKRYPPILATGHSIFIDAFATDERR